SLAEFHARNLGHRIPFVSRFKRAGEQAFLADRLVRLARVATGRPQEHQLADVVSGRSVDDVRCDQQVVVQKFGGPGSISLDAANHSGGGKYRVGTVLSDPS